MSIQRPALEPMCPAFHAQFLTDEQLDQLQQATLRVLEEVGVRFPSEKALAIFADHGAQVDHQHQVVRMPPDFVMKAMHDVPRYFRMGARLPEFDLQLQEGCTYFTTDGCGIETVELPVDPFDVFNSRRRRPSCKADVGMMARLIDVLPQIAFYWPMVSAQDFERTAPLHEMDASWNNTVKHVQSETIMGEIPCRYALEMGTVIAGSREALRCNPPFSLVVCTIAPLVQDTEGIEGALVLAEAGVPVGFLAMPTLGTTAPATLAGAFVVGDAEIVSATVLMQLAHPGAPVFHSMMHAWADPRTGGYVSYSLDARCRHGVVEMAHHWNMPSLAGCYGTDAEVTGSWQSAAEPGIDPFTVALTGAEIATGLGLANTYTLLYPEQVILDAELYDRARYALARMEVSAETLAFEAIRAVGPGGHYLGQKHTRQHMRTSLTQGLCHQLGSDNKYRDALEVAREKAAWILENHQPEPLEAAQQSELQHILAAADKELS